MKTPKAKKVDHKISIHGQTRNDEYHWLRDKNWKKFISGDLDFHDQDVLKYVESENSYKDEVMSDYKDVEKSLYNEILSRIEEDYESYPIERDNFFYYYREEKGKNYKILCRKKDSLDSKEEIYLDINEEAKPHKLYMYGPSRIGPDNKYLLYGYNLSGSMERTLKIRNLETKKDFDWEITDSNGSLIWISEDEFYYIERDEFSRGNKLFKVNIHEGPEKRKLVFTKPDEYKEMFMWVSQTNDRKFNQVYLQSGATEIVYAAPNGVDEFSLFTKGENDTNYYFEHHKGKFYIHTNDGAKDFRVMTCEADKNKWDKEHWEEFLPERPKECLDSIDIYNDYLVIERKNNKLALIEVEICSLETRELKKVTMPSVAYDLSIEGAWDHNSTKIHLSYNSPIEPEQTLELDLESCSIKKLHEKKVPNFDSTKYDLKREMAIARDGEKIPLTIVHKKGLELNGSHKSFVYAYGSYGFGMPAYFSSGIFSLVDRGFVYCIAHIRGGDDKGHEWYLEGKMSKKMNTFHDFIDSCEHLVKEKYTSAKNIAINGGSAGGLLMGAVTNMRPDLFGSVIADVAFVDVINTICDDSLPLTPPEWEEWGNPIKNKEHFDYMMQYSPYDNIKAQDYPPMLYNSGISDEQVTYWEPTKMVAKLRDLKTDGNILLLNMKMHAGHAGASKKYEWIEEKAFNYAFVLKSFGLK
jgi:oligopeptidase B